MQLIVRVDFRLNILSAFIAKKKPTTQCEPVIHMLSLLSSYCVFIQNSLLNNILVSHYSINNFFAYYRQLSKKIEEMVKKYVAKGSI